MIKKTRRKIFYLLVAVFFIIAPILIAFSLGYKVNFYKKTVEKTGGIFIKSKTTGISIFLNEGLAKETSRFSGGAILTNLAPELYIVRVEKEGYQPWFKTAIVKQELVTEFRNILMAPKSPVISTSSKEELVSINSAASQPIQHIFYLDKRSRLFGPDSNGAVAVGVNSFLETPEGNVFFVNKNGFLAQWKAATKTTQTLGRPGFYLSDIPLRFILSPQGELAIIDPSGGLFLLDTNGKITALKGGVKKAVFDKDGEKILLQKSNSVEIIWRVQNHYQPFQTQGTEEEIIKSGSLIREAVWFYKDNAHIILKSDEGIFIIEIDGRGGRNTVELVSGKTEAVVTTPQLPEKIFFKKGKVWHSLEL